MLGDISEIVSCQRSSFQSLCVLDVKQLVQFSLFYLRQVFDLSFANVCYATCPNVLPVKHHIQKNMSNSVSAPSIITHDQSFNASYVPNSNSNIILSHGLYFVREVEQAIIESENDASLPQYMSDTGCPVVTCCS